MWIALIVVGGYLALIWLMGQAKSVARGVVAGRLTDCPASPNCVCSQQDGEPGIAPIGFRGDASKAWTTLMKVVSSQPRLELITQTEAYAHFKARTLIMRYVDDLEFYLDSGKAVINVRSASRLGYSDMGANRARVERLRAALQQEDAFRP